VHAAPAAYPEAQWQALVELVAEVALRHRVPLRRIVGHRHVAPGRKVDPDDAFDWWTFGLVVAEIIRSREARRERG
jgi:N-acetyl-anhydromuramyl-L-alanine amidase AmpD